MGIAAVVLVLATFAAEPVWAEEDPLPGFIRDANEWLLSGRNLPRDYRPRLLAMEPADRVHALTYLRRLGLLTGASWPITDLLRPATVASENHQ